METTKDKIILIERVFVSTEEMLNDYKQGVSELLFADDLAKSLGLGMEFGVKITIPSNLTNELRNGVDEVTRSIMGNFWLLYDIRDRGLGVSFRQILFNHSFLTPTTAVVMTYDPDSGIIGTEDSLMRYYELGRKLSRDNALFAVGSRDQSVHLATYERNSHLREIHELYNSLTIGPEKLRVDEDIPTAAPSYREIGESNSGIHGLNLRHPGYAELDRSIIKYIQSGVDFSGFAVEYYTSIKSSTLGDIATGYVATKENPVFGTKSEEQELERVKKLIYYQTLQLGKTDVREILYETLKNSRNIDLLNQFYNRADVELIRNFMLKALEDAK